MKKLLLLFLSMPCINAGAQYAFNKDYNYAWGFSIAEIETNSYLFAGTDTSQQIGITKLDYLGNVVWNNTYGFKQGSVLTRANNNLFLVTGVTYPWSPFMLMVDSNGVSSTVNINTAVGQSFNEYEAFQTQDQNFVLSAHDTFPLLVKFDGQGNQIWRTSFPFLAYADVRFIELPDSGLIVVGDSSDFACAVMKLDQAGNIAWTKYFHHDYGASAHAITRCSDGGFMVLASFYSGMPDDPAYPWLIRFNALGDTLWTRTLLNEFADNYPVHIQQCHDGGYVLIKNIQPTWANLDLDTRIIRLDSLGNMLWNVLFPKQASIYSAQQTSDHGFILTTSDYWGTNVIKFDSLGNYVTLIAENGKEDFGIFPNPSSGKFEIRNWKADDVSVEVFNCRGQIILRQNSPGVDISAQPDGLYLVRITGKTGSRSARITKS